MVSYVKINADLLKIVMTYEQEGTTLTQECLQTRADINSEKTNGQAIVDTADAKLAVLDAE